MHLGPPGAEGAVAPPANMGQAVVPDLERPTHEPAAATATDRFMIDVRAVGDICGACPGIVPSTTTMTPPHTVTPVAAVLGGRREPIEDVGCGGGHAPVRSLAVHYARAPWVSSIVAGSGS